MDYTPVFDVTQSGFRQWWDVVFGLLFTVFGVVIFRRFRVNTSTFRRVIVFIFPVFAALFTITTLAVTLNDYCNLASALRNGQCEIVEGIVTEFDPMPYEGHKDESFVVNGHRFRYSDYQGTAGFNQSQSHGGPIHEGLAVRIHSKGNEIAKLEIAKSKK